MAASLEIRVPLLDNRLLEYTSSLPEELKYRNGAGKYLLKKLLAKYVPTELFERPKMVKDCLIMYLLKKRSKNTFLEILTINIACGLF